MDLYDKVIAINQRDQLLISDLIGRSRVVLAGHPSPSLLAYSFKQSKEQIAKCNPTPRILFLASRGAANLDALQVLISHVVPSLFVLSENAFEFLIAGSICLDPFAQELVNSSSMYPVTCLGTVESLLDLYASVDIVSNPVRFGGGLKIKNIEALAAGCALVTSSEGSYGLPVTDPPCFLAADNPDEHSHELLELITNPSLLISLRNRAAQAARLHLSPENVYKNLRTYLDSLSSFRE
jgi:glycosyltransferase involved in cell wall biosynthesis